MTSSCRRCAPLYLRSWMASTNTGSLTSRIRLLFRSNSKNIRSIGSLRYAVENFEGKWALFTDTGRQLTNFTVDNILPFQNNYAIIYQGAKQGLIDRDGITKIEPRHQEIKINSNGSVYTRASATWLFLDG